MSASKKWFIVVPLARSPQGTENGKWEKARLVMGISAQGAANYLREREGFADSKAVHVYRLTRPERVPYGLEETDDPVFPAINPHFT